MRTKDDVEILLEIKVLIENGIIYFYFYDIILKFDTVEEFKEWINNNIFSKDKYNAVDIYFLNNKSDIINFIENYDNGEINYFYSIPTFIKFSNIWDSEDNSNKDSSNKDCDEYIEKCMSYKNKTSVELDNDLISTENKIIHYLFDKISFTKKKQILKDMIILNWLKIYDIQKNKKDDFSYIKRINYYKNEIDKKELLLIKLQKDYFKIDDEKIFRMLSNEAITDIVKLNGTEATQYRLELLRKLESDILQENTENSIIH